MFRLRFQVALTGDGRKIRLRHRDTQRCYHLAKFGQCGYLLVDPDGNAVFDSQEAEAGHRGQKQKDEIRGVQRGATKRRRTSVERSGKTSDGAGLAVRQGQPWRLGREEYE